MKERIKSFFVGLYKQLVGMNDSPLRIAVGFGIGVFLGILPGTGPFAALAASFVFKVNKAAILLGCLMTNSWLSIVSFIVSIKIGSAVLGIDWKTVKDQAYQLFHHFAWKDVFDVSLLGILKPLLIGYAVVGFLSGLFACLCVYLILVLFKKPAA